MKLATLGLVTVVLGLALGVPGLIISGAVWIPLGLILRLTVSRLRERAPSAGHDADAETGAAEAEEAEATGGQPGFWTGTLMLLAVAIPSLAIGILGIGFSGDDSDWRWLPIAIGALAGGIGALSILMYAAGSGIEAAIGDPQHPGEVWIEGSRETGTYINERPRIEFDLLVRPEGLPEYRVKKKATVPHTALANIGVGDGFGALVDPEDEDSIAIDWERPLSGREVDVGARLERLEHLERDGLISADEHAAQRARILDSI